jgi:PIN domain nuclease of toxin-antitoxin system
LRASGKIAIKAGLGKLTLSGPFADTLNKAIVGYGLIVLPITFEDCEAYAALPFPLQTHRDPFDRLIITQAKRINASIVGADACFDSYGVVRLW